jgi:DNA-binding MarR family transcriptional regulator
VNDPGQILLGVLVGAIGTGLAAMAATTVWVRLHRRSQNELKALSWELSMEQARLLAALAHEDHRSAADLAAKTQMTPADVYAALRSLAGQGWIEFDKPSESIPVVHLSRSGARGIELTVSDRATAASLDEVQLVPGDGHSPDDLDAAIDDAVRALPRH